MIKNSPRFFKSLINFAAAAMVLLLCFLLARPLTAIETAADGYAAGSAVLLWGSIVFVGLGSYGLFTLPKTWRLYRADLLFVLLTGIGLLIASLALTVLYGTVETPLLAEGIPAVNFLQLLLTGVPFVFILRAAALSLHNDASRAAGRYRLIVLGVLLILYVLLLVFGQLYAPLQESDIPALLE